MRKRKKVRRPPAERTPLSIATKVNEVWRMDFVSDILVTGRRLKCLTVADDFSHEAVDVAVVYGISGQYVIRLPDQAARFRGYLCAVHRSEITPDVYGWVAASGLRDGLLTLFVRHTPASLLIQENADPDVRADLERFFARLVADGDPLLRHRDEGPDDMPAHVRAALTAVQLSIPVSQGAAVLGTWQGIYLWEHRLRPPRRDGPGQARGLGRLGAFGRMATP